MTWYSSPCLDTCEGVLPYHQVTLLPEVVHANQLVGLDWADHNGDVHLETDVLPLRLACSGDHLELDWPDHDGDVHLETDVLPLRIACSGDHLELGLIFYLSEEEEKINKHFSN